MNKHWASIRERGNQFGIKFLVFCYTYGGRWLAVILLYPIILYFFITGKAERKSSMDFLQTVYQFDDKCALTHPPTLWDSYKHFLSFGFAALDKVDSWLGKISSDGISYQHYEQFEQLQQSKLGAVFIGSHLGNLEVCRALSTQKYPVRINVLVFTQHAESFNRMLKELNQEVDLNIIQVNQLGPDIAIMLKDRIENGEYVVIVGDRTPINNPDRTSKCQFLGKTAHFSQGPLILAHLLDCPVYLLFCVKVKSHFRVIFEPFCTPKVALKRKTRQQQLSELNQKYADRLAYHAIRYPLQWFNFFDFWQHELATDTKEHNVV